MFSTILVDEERQPGMNFRRLTIASVILFLLACNFAAGPSAVVGVTQTPAYSSTATAAISPSPVYIPPGCQNVPLATIPAATALAEPTPFLQANPEVPGDLQQQVFDELVGTIGRVYVYPDFNGNNWPEMVARYQGKIDAGLDTETFYAELQSMVVELGDEHSWLESPVEVVQADADLAGTNDFVGIGIYFLPMPGKGSISVISVFPDSPAKHSGLQPHDSILTVDGVPIIQDGLDYSHIVRGPECSAVVLSVLTPGQAPREITFVRQRIQGSYAIQAQLLPTADGSRMGYIFLPTFYDETIPGQVADALESFGELDGLILDNRMNGGGSSTVLEPILGYFVSGMLGEYASRSDSRPMVIKADPIHNSQTVPIVVLVSEETASFGEVFSGVLKDSGRAKIVGQPSLGNVEILHGYDFSDGSRLWIAEETFSPSNSHANWEETGIVPDVEAYADWDTFTFETDPSIAAAIRALGH